MIEPCRQLTELGLSILATGARRKRWPMSGVPVTRINKVFEGRPHIVDAIQNGEVQLIFTRQKAPEPDR